MTAEEAKNKLRTLYAGSKKDALIGRIASTFAALCDYADFSGSLQKPKAKPPIPPKTDIEDKTKGDSPPVIKSVSLDSLQYHVNIILPESRDQAVYDAIFKTLRDHLGTKNG